MEALCRMSNNSDGSLLERSAQVKTGMSANQLAAKAMQLRLKGEHEEAEKLMVKHKIIGYGIFSRLVASYSLCSLNQCIVFFPPSTILHIVRTN